MATRDSEFLDELQKRWDAEEAAADRRQRRIKKDYALYCAATGGLHDASTFHYPSRIRTEDGRAFDVWEHACILPVSRVARTVRTHKQDGHTFKVVEFEWVHNDDLNDEAAENYLDQHREDLGNLRAVTERDARKQAAVTWRKSPHTTCVGGVPEAVGRNHWRCVLSYESERRDTWRSMRHVTASIHPLSVAYAEDLCERPLTTEARKAAEREWQRALIGMLAAIDELPRPEACDFSREVAVAVIGYLEAGMRGEIRERLIDHGHHSFDCDWRAWLVRKVKSMVPGGLITQNAVDHLGDAVDAAIRLESSYRTTPPTWQHWSRSQKFRYYLRVAESTPARFLEVASITRAQRIAWLDDKMPAWSKPCRRIERIMLDAIGSKLLSMAA